MPANVYRFITHWRVQGAVEEVSGILGDATDLARWWPSVYLSVDELAPGGADGVGREVDLHTRGWLPYTLCWWFRVTESRAPRGFTIEAYGDFEGVGVWAFEQSGSDVLITYDWQIAAEKPLLRWLSPVLKPVFAANHRWAMARGEESLRIELARRHATTEAELAAIAPPPGPAASVLPIALVSAGVLGLCAIGVVAMRSLLPAKA